MVSLNDFPVVFAFDDHQVPSNDLITANGIVNKDTNMR